MQPLLLDHEAHQGVQMINGRHEAHTERSSDLMTAQARIVASHHATRRRFKFPVSTDPSMSRSASPDSSCHLPIICSSLSGVVTRGELSTARLRSPLVAR